MEDNQLAPSKMDALMEVLAQVNLASEEIIGKAAPMLMYHTGKDLGRREGMRMDKTEELEEALRMVFAQEDGAWEIEMWKDLEEGDYWYGEGLEMKMRLLFRKCPVREACLSKGVRLGGVVCQIVHGYAAGCLELHFEKKVDLHTEHMGPGNCMIVLETTME